MTARDANLNHDATMITNIHIVSSCPSWLIDFRNQTGESRAVNAVEYDNDRMKLEHIQGVNAGYVAELYERYRENPESVDAATRDVFESWVPADQAQQAARVSGVDIHVIVGAANLAECLRRYGHLAAQLDPLGSAPPGDPSLSPGSHRISDEDLKHLPASLVGGAVADTSASAYEAIEKLRRI